MKKNALVIGLAAAILTSLVLAVSVASVGSQLDAERDKRVDLELQVDDLTQQKLDAEQAATQAKKNLEAVTAERDQWKTKASQADVNAGQVPALQTQLSQAQQRVQSLETQVQQLQTELQAAKAAHAPAAAPAPAAKP